VDAVAIVNGYSNGGTALSTGILGRSAQYFSSTIGTPLWNGPGVCDDAPDPDGLGCFWSFTAIPLPTATQGANYIAGYASDVYGDFQQDLTNSGWPAFANGATPNSNTSVINSVDLEPVDGLFALSWIQSNPPGGFDMKQMSVSPEELQAAVSAEGSFGRVITAISQDGSNATFLSYGWDADVVTIYDAQVVSVSVGGAADAATNLAQQGYIITARGRADDGGSLYLVGTRVRGDTLARPFTVAHNSSEEQSMLNEGYAIVGVLEDTTGALIFLGQR